ncbi:MAG: hypothetical protein E7463_04790 [Ruminococcaceae bacterium]|nr:hypothetical protein [Oscillospiraceae bacterium]
MKRFTAWIAGLAACLTIGICICLILLGFALMLWPEETLAVGMGMLGLTCIAASVCLAVQIVRSLKDQRMYMG